MDTGSTVIIEAVNFLINLKIGMKKMPDDFYACISSVCLDMLYIPVTAVRITDGFYYENRKGELFEPFRGGYFGLMLDIESLHGFTRALLDDTARLTPYFYSRAGNVKGMKTRTFDAQRRWYAENIDFDPEFAVYLKEQTVWVDGLEDRGDGFVPGGLDPFNFSGLEDRDVPKRLGFPLKERLNKPAIERDLAGLISGLLSYIGFYHTHFRKKVEQNYMHLTDKVDISASVSVSALKKLDLYMKG
ncbi:MAG: hypothetical protein A2X49_00530 [Lentisphaerae bacterium GWF2_52_8]|nr:MAG: hypothetical protein A2X49_00530 [Lentisphaerae bacterium GWF2_52_8]